MLRHLIIVMAVFTLLIVSAQAQAQPPVPRPPAPAPAQSPAARRPAPAALAPLSVLSIIPAQGEPGQTVTLNGTGFTTATSVFLGNRELPATVVAGRILTVEIPDLPPGVYALYLRREDGSTSRPYNFLLQPLKPFVSSLSPDTVTSCASGREREVVLSGANFQSGARVLLDGAAIATRFISPSALSFVVPQLNAGLHQIQVKNPSDAASGVLALFLDSVPAIGSVAIGAEYVNYYELILTGKNFQQTSVLVADGDRVTTGTQVVGERDQLIFQGCNQLVYQRHPYDPTPKEIQLQVVNRNGEESGVFTINAP